MNALTDLLNKKSFVILDGAMGTELQKSGLELGEIPEKLSITAPQEIIKIHKSYIDAGADIIYANTFGANRYKLKESGLTVNEVIKASVLNARKACVGTSVLTALDLGPIGQLLEPTGALSFENAYDIFKEQITAGADADIIVFETMTDLYELKAGILAARENSNKPIMCTMTFEENGRTFTGVSVSAMALTLNGLGVDAIGLNCSLGPKQLYPIIKELSEWTGLPIIVKPNAGLPDPLTNTYNISAPEFAKQISSLVPLGIRLVGGCCGTDPQYIREVCRILKDKKYTEKKRTIQSAICSPTNTVCINEPRIIGERINPTGKKLFKQALIDNNIDYILNQAIEQVNAGADILDVNVGLPDIDEKSMMIKCIKAIQGIIDVPLQIDSTIPEVLDSALRVYNGKAIVNSVNGEEKSLSQILPIVKKYGASVIGLTLDRNGIPKTATERFEIAQKIVDTALKYGIQKEDIYIDCLTLTASAEQDRVMETLKALKMCKEKLGVKTVLGVSNISFGLPNRELVNHNFLTMALTYGLDLPIINPNVVSMTGAVMAFKLLTSIDKNSTNFIEKYSNANKTISATVNESKCIDISYAIQKGLKTEGREITKQLLETHDAMDIINNMLIPALDNAGSDFEKGIVFLPQLIQSAGVAQGAFDVIKQKLIIDDKAPVSKGKIVLATVKGDIHDIGKNIVKVLLENYGYTVIDLGRDVEYDNVVNCAKENECKLVGLSALMTTTLKSMEKTITALKQSGYDGKIMVGGAVLTPDYAIKIGADFYAKDAKESVDIAKKVLG